MIVFAKGFIPLSPRVCCFDNGYVEKQPVAWMERILCGVLVKRTQGRIDRCTGRRDMTEVLLKTALNTIQSINQSMKKG